jgi:hypothetical protein
MSAISTIYNEIHALMGTLYPDKRELVDNIDISNNDEISLRDGYGIYIGSAINSQRKVGCSLSIERSFDIIFTRVIKGSHKNKTALETAEKAILEDAYTIINRLENDDDDISAAAKCYYVSDNGMQRVIAGQYNLITMELTFSVEYFENLS